jgi:Tfp pilus assembly protein PilF
MVRTRDGIASVQTSRAALVAPTEASRVAAIWPVLIVAAVVATFANGISGVLLLDDESSILTNGSIRHLTDFSKVFSPRTETVNAGRPLLNLSYALNYAADGTNVTGYHLANILIHALAALTLFGIVRRTLVLPRWRGRFQADAPALAAFAAVLWAVHPLQTESVTYLSQRAESLMGLFYLLTLYGFIRAAEQPRSWWAIATPLACLAGMSTKEVMVTAPVAVLLYDRAFLTDSLRDALTRRYAMYLALASSWLVLAALMAGTHVQARGIGVGLVDDWAKYLRLECGVVLYYLRLILWPRPLIFDYGVQVTMPSALASFAQITALIAIGLGLVVACRRLPALTFLGCCFFLILSPTSSVVPVTGQPIAENRVYLPLAAVVVTVVLGAYYWLGRRIWPLLVIGAIALAGLAGTRNRDYGSELTMWTDTARKRPGNARALSHYGGALFRAGRVDEALTALEQSARIQPTVYFVQSNLASIYLTRNRLPEALQHFEFALRLNPNDAMLHSNYGTALFEAGRIDDALAQDAEALRCDPDNTGARINFGVTLAQVGRFPEAIAALEESVRRDPANPSAQKELAKLHEFLASQPTRVSH